MFSVVSPPLVGALLDLTGSFSAGLLTLAAFTLAVLGSTPLLRPFAFDALSRAVPAPDGTRCRGALRS